MSERAPILAGMFYPAEPAALSRSVDNWLRAGAEKLTAGERHPEPAVIAMLPHAGHVYCGRIIGETLAAAILPNRLIMLCPSHTGEGSPLAVWPEGSWGTPLGRVKVDVALASALLESGGGYVADRRAHAREHSIEVLLPFIQRALPEAEIVPVVVSARPEALRLAGEALAGVLRSQSQAGWPAAVIVSSDMNHYADEAATLRLDDIALQVMMDLAPARLFNTVARERISMCGVQPATVALFAAAELGLSRTRLIAHTTSAEASGDTSRVVGYAGLLIG